LTRHAPAQAKLADMNKQRVMLDASIDGSVIRGTPTWPTGDRREFHDWLELNTVGPVASPALAGCRCQGLNVPRCR